MYGTENKRKDNWISYKEEELIHLQYPNPNQNHTRQRQKKTNLSTQQKPTNKALIKETWSCIKCEGHRASRLTDDIDIDDQSGKEQLSSNSKNEKNSEPLPATMSLKAIDTSGYNFEEASIK